MENQNNNTQNMTSSDYPVAQTAKPLGSRKSPLQLQQIAKITLVIFILSLSLVAVFGIIDIWHPSNIFGAYTKFEGTLAVLSFTSFILNLGLRIYMGIKKFD